MANNTGNGTPPFYNTPTKPIVRSTGEEKKRQGLSSITMLLGWVALTVAMVGGAKLLWDILTDGLASAGLLAKVISLGLAFLLGWIVSLVCIRALGNLVLPLIINFYVFLTASGILVLYARVVYKLYSEIFDANVHYTRYSIAVGAGFAVLVGLHLLIEDHDLRPFSIPFLIGGVMHLSGMVVHYVFMNGNQEDIGGDVYFFGLIMLIALLMMAHFGIFNIPRQIISHFFVKNGHTLQPGNQKTE
ncbi:MAG: hypothetical protein CVU44_18870 [Chloroflexi bacterium HGW-Chloroflexi-6]|nr:MAG: hypothetical protein CVU44_18870 [Chloroflexi bacterium HGW-Chloroflexi-6]